MLPASTRRPRTDQEHRAHLRANVQTAGQEARWDEVGRILN
jgi:hypothetical protein